jgi:glycosyltransferase involved in cell wall biosynthesis
LTQSLPRVLVLFSSSQLGGAERSLTRMVLASDADSISYDLATLDGPGPWSEWCTALGMQAHTLGKKGKHGEHGQFGIRAVLKALKLVRSQRYSIIYVIGLRASLAIRLLKPFLRGARIVSGVRWNPASNSNLDRAFELTERRLGFLVDLYISNSKAGELTLHSRAGIAPAKTLTIHNGLEAYPQDATPIQARSPKVVTLANISPRKGYLKYLENVVAPITAARPEVCFVVAGRDDMNGQLQRAIHDLGMGKSVKFMGFVSDVAPILRDARVFVLPSLSGEGCPTSVLEAMAYGVPPITFEIDGIPELITQNVTGYMAQPADYAAMQTAILQTLDDDSFAANLANNARRAVADRFLMEQCAQRHRQAFEKLAAR